jgi:hypothetical protein
VFPSNERKLGRCLLTRAHGTAYRPANAPVLPYSSVWIDEKKAEPVSNYIQHDSFGGDPDCVIVNRAVIYR